MAGNFAHPVVPLDGRCWCSVLHGRLAEALEARVRVPRANSNIAVFKVERSHQPSDRRIPARRIRTVVEGKSNFTHAVATGAQS